MAKARHDESSALDRLVSESRRQRLLSRAEEQELARHYHRTGDRHAAEVLITANIRFVVKTAHQYRGYQIDLADLVQEGLLGLARAVETFDPDSGNRLITYAVWWVRAYIQSYIVRSWSLVKMGTTQAERRMFFKLRQTDEAVARDANATDPEREVAARLGVDPEEVVAMRPRLGMRDRSLDQPVEQGAREHVVDLLEGDALNPEEGAARLESRRLVRSIVDQALQHMSDKERAIVRSRLLADAPLTLREIGERFGVSRERIRQIETRLLRDLRRLIDTGGIDSAAAYS